MRRWLHAPHVRQRSVVIAALAALALLGSFLAATPAQALSDTGTGTGGVFVPVTGARIVDSSMTGKQWKTVQVAGKGGVPSDGSAGAVAVVATLIGISNQGILTGRPNAGEPSTTMGIYGGENKQNTSFSAVLAVNSDGTIQVSAETNARLLLDVQGYYTANTDGTAPGGFVPMNGSRIVDTRNGTGTPKAALTSGKTVDLQVGGVAGVPKDASAVIVNMIAANTGSTSGYFTPYPTGSTRPPNSFNYAGGGVATSMQAQVKLSSAGKLTVFNQDSTADLVLEVQGYFTAAGKGGAVFTPGAGRAYDTRTSGNTVMGKNETRSIQIAGKAGVPVMGSGINAVVLTITALKSTAGNGNATVWADGTTRPSTTSINFDETTIRTNTITVPLGANGKVSLNNVADATNYVFDVQGWYANPTTPTISCPDPYSAGAWLAEVPASPVTCTVVTSPALTSGENLVVRVDDADPVVVAVSETTTTQTSVQIPALRGTHSIVADRVSDDGTVTGDTSYEVTLGNWTSAALSGSPTGGEETHLRPYLTVVLDGDDMFPVDATFDYIVTNPSSGDLVWESGTTSKPSVQVETDLLSGVSYSWYAKVTGSVDIAGTQGTITSPTYEFVASDHAAGDDQDPTTGQADGWTASSADETGDFTPSANSTIGMSARYATVPYCDSRANTSKTVRTYERKAFGGVVKRGGVGTLICGTPGGLGMRHIWSGHGGDWTRVANKYPTGIAAESLMDQAINTTLRAPSSVEYRRSNDTYTYNAPLQIKKGGKVVRTYTVRVAMAADSWKIITAFPV